jgi:hypothetical protein
VDRYLRRLRSFVGKRSGRQRRFIGLAARQAGSPTRAAATPAQLGGAAASRSGSGSDGIIPKRCSPGAPSSPEGCSPLTASSPTPGRSATGARSSMTLQASQKRLLPPVRGRCSSSATRRRDDAHRARRSHEQAAASQGLRVGRQTSAQRWKQPDPPRRPSRSARVLCLPTRFAGRHRNGDPPITLNPATGASVHDRVALEPRACELRLATSRDATAARSDARFHRPAGISRHGSIPGLMRTRSGTPDGAQVARRGCWRAPRYRVGDVGRSEQGAGGPDGDRVWGRCGASVRE